MAWKKCQKCKGTGVVSNGKGGLEDCPACKGQGGIETDTI